ncbi:gypsy/ty3 retroelement polyprotein [Tanacetum coccineum]
MWVTRKVRKHVLHILVDCGSTHNFFDDNVAKRIGCLLKDTCPLAVTVGGGKQLISTQECKDFVWQLQGETFKDDMMILPLGGCEMVLGIQWLATLGDIKCNFSQLKMEFVYNRRRMVLRGAPKTTLQWIEVYSQTIEEHVTHLQMVLERMRRHKLYAKLSKCVSGTTHVEYLGHVISKGVSTKPNKVKDMQEWPIPTTLKQLRGFLGLTRYCRRFIKGFASLSRPLTQLLKKNAFKWTSEAQLSFEALKKAMMEALVLGLPDFNKPFVIATDALGVGLCAVLQQIATTKRPSYCILKSFQFEVSVGSEDYHTYLKKWLPKLMGYD